VDRLCFDVLDRRGARLKPVPIRTASGATENFLMMGMRGILSLMFDDASTHHFLDFDARVDGASRDAGDRVFSSMLTANWYIDASQKVPSGTALAAIYMFDDGTVRSSTGAKYHPMIALNGHLPLEERHRRENMLIVAFRPIVRIKPDDRRFLAMSPTERQAWRKREQDSINSGVLSALLAELQSCRAGVKVGEQLVAGRQPSLLVPTIGCWQLDHPQHMSHVGCKRCGFCESPLHLLGKFGETFAMRTTARCEPLYDAAVEARGAVAAYSCEGTKEVLATALEALVDAGLNEVSLPEWQPEIGRCPPRRHAHRTRRVTQLTTAARRRYTDAYKNKSPSPLHMLKGAYKDILQWTLYKVYVACGTHVAWLALLKRFDEVVVRDLAAFTAVRGACKRKGLSSILIYSASSEPPVVRGGSKVRHREPAPSPS